MFKFLVYISILCLSVNAGRDLLPCNDSLIVTIEGCPGTGSGDICVVQKETPIDVVIIVTPTEDVPSGKFVIDVLYLGLTIEVTNRDICQLTPCPLQAGVETTITFSLNLPSSVPSITTECHVRILNSVGDTVACTIVNVQII